MDRQQRKSFLVSVVFTVTSLVGAGAQAAEAGGGVQSEDQNYAGVDLQFATFDHELLNSLTASVLRAKVGRRFEMDGDVGKWVHQLAVEAHLGIGLDMVNDEQDETQGALLPESQLTTDQGIVNAEMEVDMVAGLYARANWLFSDNKVNVYALAGYGMVDMDVDVGPDNETFDEAGLGGGIGFQYTVKDNLGVNVDVMGWDADDDYDVYSVSAGAVFNF